MTTPLSKTCINWCAAAALLQHVFSFLIHPQLVRLFHCCLRGSQSTARAFWIVQVCGSHFTWPQTFCLKKTPAFRCSSTTAIQQRGSGSLMAGAEASKLSWEDLFLISRKWKPSIIQNGSVYSWKMFFPPFFGGFLLFNQLSLQARSSQIYVSQPLWSFHLHSMENA